VSGRGPTNRQLLGAVVALSFLATLLCAGVLLGQGGLRRADDTAQARLRETEKRLRARDAALAALVAEVRGLRAEVDALRAALPPQPPLDPP